MTNEIVPASHQVVDLSRPGLPAGEVDPLAIIEQRNKLLDRILDAAIKSTHAGQWTNLGGKPWPTGPAAESMARRCAVSVTNMSREKLQSNDDKGPFYIWVYRATFALPGKYDLLEAEGTCSSRDTFLGTETQKGRELSECDEGSIMKAASTNCRVNGICQLLGVRNMTWERLEQLGIRQGEVAKVEYDHGAKGGGRKPTDDVEIRFGKGKDKNLSELPDDDVRWYIAAWEKDLGDESKAKYHANSRRSIEIGQKILAARLTAKAGQGQNAGQGAPQGQAGNGGQGAPAGTSSPATVWQRVLALPEAAGMKQAEIAKEVKAAVGKSPADLAEADLAKIQAALGERKQAEKDGQGDGGGATP